MVAFTDLDFFLSLFIKVVILIYFFGLSPAVGVNLLERRKCTCLSQRANLSCWYQSSCESVSTCVSQSVGVPRFLLFIIFIFFLYTYIPRYVDQRALVVAVQNGRQSWRSFRNMLWSASFSYSSSPLLSVLALGPTVICTVYSCLSLGPELGRL